MRHRTTLIPALALAIGLLACPAAPARASLPALSPLQAFSVPSVVTLAMAQVEDEHDHGEGLASDADPWRNLAAPFIMVAAGVLYLGFARWKVGRQRGHGGAR